MPAAQADPPLVRGVRYAGINTHNLVALSLQIETATHSTERASGELGSHEFCLTHNYPVPEKNRVVQRTLLGVTSDVMNRDSAGKLLTCLAIRCQHSDGSPTVEIQRWRLSERLASAADSQPASRALGAK